MKKKELELYIHIPFCVKKCAYCDFLSFPAREDEQQRYVDAIVRELGFYGKIYAGREIATVFIGGGTPSYLAAEQILTVMEAVRRVFSLRADAEISIECNPGTVTEHKLRLYRGAGINRLSIGLQSAHDDELRLLGRIHTYRQFLKTYELARKCGFSNLNIDLMSALPGQTAERFADSLRRVLSLKPEHVSVYTLIVEEGTPFFETYGADARRREAGDTPLFLPDEDEEYRTMKRTREMLIGAGYHWYEVSNFARPGYECRHNLGYWKRADYLGVGLGAASLVDNVRYANTRDLHAYLAVCEAVETLETQAGKSVSGGVGNLVEILRVSKEPLSKKEQMEEFLFLGLRLRDGFSRREFEEAFQMPVEAVCGEALSRLQNEGMLVKSEGRVIPTERGMDYNDYVAGQLIP